MEKKDFMFLGITDCTEETLINETLANIDQNKKSFCVAINTDLLRMSYKNKNFRKTINKADYCIVDGKPLMWLSKIFRYKIKNKVSGSDLAMPLLKMLAKNNKKVLIVGGREGVADKAKIEVNKEIGTEVIIDTICPEFGFEKDESKTKNLVSQINSSRAEVVFLCLGAPKQELFYENNKELFDNKCFFCMGATVDFLAKNIKRAPKWMRKIGLEWFYRMCKEPRRLFKRYWLDFWFLIRIFNVRLFKKKKIRRMRNDYEENSN